MPIPIGIDPEKLSPEAREMLEGIYQKAREDEALFQLFMYFLKEFACAD